ncbi:hypothetical protein [Flavobacterium hungaricum]|uniref:DUF2939 domain-containing protein n=1 Tax=Flavobacterium hungaricum TaxID=2082725 RepID=A0ABR9TSH8_9FLAO|nr:hypothetical protein [Flavobacterium hungaricum]MBE8727992.1 hypothetical protein [Flavobacterium hungaricum]
MQVSAIVQNLKILWLILVACVAVWFFKDYQHQKEENIRQSENISQLRKSDSLRFTSQVLTPDEIKEYLQYGNSDLKNKLEASGVKLNRIESIVSNAFKFRDTTKKETDVTGLVDAIKNSIPKQQTWSDSVNCLITSGVVSFDGQKIKVVVQDRQFENKSDAVAYWERHQWKFLGIKTRLFGKKVFTVKTFDQCGESQIMKIEKKK